MEAGKLALLKMKASPFAGTRILGQVVSRGNGLITMRDCCMIHDFVHQDRTGEVSIRPVYMMNNIESEGTWVINEEREVAAIREVRDGEDMLKLYDDTFARYKANKAGIALPQQLRPNQQV